MSSFLDLLQEESEQLHYNPDGTMKPEYRSELRSDGWSEEKINSTESRHIRRAATDKEVAEWQQELKRQIAEDNARVEAERRVRAERLGIEYKPPTPSVNKFNRQTRAQKMAGLDREELLSQGFLEPDDFYTPSAEAPPSAPSVYTRPAVEPPDIAF